MLREFKIWPRELLGVGFNLYDEQLAMADQKEGWVMVPCELSEAVDQIEQCEHELITADGKDLRTLLMPVPMWFGEDFGCLYDKPAEESVAEHLNEYMPKGWLDWPMLLGYRDTPWYDHRGCMCDEDMPDAQFYWECWPLNELGGSCLADAIGKADELVLRDLREWCSLWPWIQEDQISRIDSLDYEARTGELFRPDGRLYVSSKDLDIESLTDNREVIEGWWCLKRSTREGGRKLASYRKSDLERSGSWG